MSEKKNLSRAEQVRLRRERTSSTRVERARKESTRTTPVSSRRQTGDAVAQPRRRLDQTGPSRPGRGARRRFQNALLPVAPDAELRGLSIARPNLGRRLPSFLLVALLASVI